MTARRSRPSHGAIDPQHVHMRGASIETEPLPKELENEIESADADNAILHNEMIQDSLFQMSANHKSLKSAELTSDDGADLDDNATRYRSVRNHKYTNNNGDTSSDSESVTSHEKRRSARDSMIMEDLLGISTNDSATDIDDNANGYRNGVGNGMDSFNRRSSTKLNRVIKSMHDNANSNGNGNGAKADDSGNHRDSIDMAIAQNGEAFLTERKNEQKWTHARKASTNIVRKQSSNSVKSNDSGFSTNPFAKAFDGSNDNDKKDTTNDNNLNSGNSHSSLAFEITYQSDSESDENGDGIANMQNGFASNKTNAKQRPSINTALKQFDSPGELESDIAQKMAKEDKFRHARKTSTMIAKQTSGHSDGSSQNVNNIKSQVTSINEQNPFATASAQASKLSKMEEALDRPEAMNDTERDIWNGIEKQKQLERHHNSKISRQFSGSDMAKLKNRNGDSDSESEHSSDDAAAGAGKAPSRPNKARGSTIIRGIEVEQLAEVTGKHKREESLAKAYMGAFNNDSNVAPIANILAGFMAGGTTAPPKQTEAKEERKNEEQTAIDKGENKKLLKQIDDLQKENERLRKENGKIAQLQKENDSLRQSNQNMEDSQPKAKQECGKCGELRNENTVLLDRLKKINDAFQTDREQLERHISNLESAKIESISQMAVEFNNMRAAIKSFNVHKK